MSPAKGWFTVRCHRFEKENGIFNKDQGNKSKLILNLGVYQRCKLILKFLASVFAKVKRFFPFACLGFFTWFDLVFLSGWMFSLMLWNQTLSVQKHFSLWGLLVLHCYSRKADNLASVYLWAAGGHHFTNKKTQENDRVHRPCGRCVWSTSFLMFEVTRNGRIPVLVAQAAAWDAVGHLKVRLHASGKETLEAVMWVKASVCMELKFLFNCYRKTIAFSRNSGVIVSCVFCFWAPFTSRIHVCSEF